MILPQLCGAESLQNGKIPQQQPVRPHNRLGHRMYGKLDGDECR